MTSKREASPERYRQLTGKEQVSFINYDFDDSTRRKFKEWFHEQIEHTFDMVDALVDSGYSVSIKRDNRNQCYSSFIIPTDDKSRNAGFILAGRGSTTLSAIMGALYRHLVVFDGQWPTQGVRRVGLDDD